MAAMAALQITTLAIDDVKKAFDFVPIAPLMETFAEHIVDESLLQLVETVLRGGEDRDRAVGIPQGSPLSPLALNVYLHHAHDLPLEADVTFPPFFRYADNLVYLCEGVPEGQRGPGPCPTAPGARRPRPQGRRRTAGRPARGGERQATGLPPLVA